ncbi:putative Vacuolar membrane associated protein Iml1 [Trypanosoma vivax]|uniref:Vacuolar membrane-associated protein Iml1 N-terminal domain-containing protein n=1 Tax=Trypanosoma vivax (strain Y486) TaxID=1055687 RepID=G0U024_TRYVY|nr:hypothetical protein TRVL_05967 [Trypanosoma vivax]KAH8614137.1 putative Vacuolar membrane associated protein Iml1 [Trypanosoma vivax]CCC49421.1 conserved hypothetical protein [Trypanosoma vivax Y486]
MECVRLQRRRRQSTKQATDKQNDAPVTVVFRSHADSLSKAQFLYCPKNYGLPPPSQSQPFTEVIIELCAPYPCRGDRDAEIVKPGAIAAAARPQSNQPQPTTSRSLSMCSQHLTGNMPSSMLDKSAGRTEVTETLDAIQGGVGPVSRPPGLCGTQIDAFGTSDTNSEMCESWVCRAYCFGEKDMAHSSGAISVHQSLASKSGFINDITNGRSISRVVSSYDEVRMRFGLSHVELSFENQQIPRAEMFLISEAVRDHILYEGQELVLFGFTMKVNEMLRERKGSTQANHDADVRNDNMAERRREDKDSGKYHTVRCGLVTDSTLINFVSLSATHYLILELAAEMWNPTIDGRIVLDWAVKDFLGEYVSQQIPKYKVSPRLSLVMAGQLRAQYAIDSQANILHMMKVPQDYRTTSLTEEVNLQCEALLQRVLVEIRQSWEAKDEGDCSGNVVPSTAAEVPAVENLFVPSKHARTIETVALLLEKHGQYGADHHTGVIITIISAGKGVFRISNDFSHATCARLFVVGAEKVNVICMGCPPLHVTPLLEYTTEDESLRQQYHLNIGHGHRCFYEQPEWIRCCFYHPAPGYAASGILAFELFTREEWLFLHRMEHQRQSGCTISGVSSSTSIAGLALPFPLQGDGLLLPLMSPERGANQPIPVTLPANTVNLESTSVSEKKSKAHGASMPTVTNCHSLGRINAQRERAPGVPWGASANHNNISYTNSNAAPTQVSPQVNSECGTAYFVQSTWFFMLGRSSQRTVPTDFKSKQGFESRCEREQNLSYTYSRCGAAVPLKSSFVSCGNNILDSDLQGGYVTLRLQINPSVLPGAVWSPLVLGEEDGWALLMDSFYGVDGHAMGSDEPWSESKFVAANTFNREQSTIFDEGRALILPTQGSNIAYTTQEKIYLRFHCGLFDGLKSHSIEPNTTLRVSALHGKHVANVKDRDGDQPVSAIVAHVQIRNSTLFAIKPTNPHRPLEDADILTTTTAGTHSVSTEIIMRRRWHFSHPEHVSPLRSVASIPGRGSLWASLCLCKALPLYGMRSAYPRDSFFDKPTHQYSISLCNKMESLEYVLQRLHQQYQIVVSGTSVSELTWPRRNPTVHAKIEMTIGHQIHELKIGEAGQSIHITRLMHRGMYCNSPVVPVVKHTYLLLNYLEMRLSVRDVSLELRIGEEKVFKWETLDSYLCGRHDLGAVALQSPKWRYHGNEICVALLPEVVGVPLVPFTELLEFVGCIFSLHLIARAPLSWTEDFRELSQDIPDEMDYPEVPSVLCVPVSIGKAHLPARRCVIDHETGRTTSMEEGPPSRKMMIDATLPASYNRRCYCPLKLSWLACPQAVLAEWLGSLQATVTRYHLRFVPIPTYNHNNKQESLVAQYTVRARSAEEEPLLRRALLCILTSQAYTYLPNVSAMNRNCRLLHATGFCFVTSPPDREVVAQWYENSMLRTGQPEHSQLLSNFIEAVQLARKQLSATSVKRTAVV